MTTAKDWEADPRKVQDWLRLRGYVWMQAIDHRIGQAKTTKEMQGLLAEFAKTAGILTLDLEDGKK